MSPCRPYQLIAMRWPSWIATSCLFARIGGSRRGGDYRWEVNFRVATSASPLSCPGQVIELPEVRLYPKVESARRQIKTGLERK